MSRKTIAYFIVGIITYFAIYMNVFAVEIVKEYSDYYQFYYYNYLSKSFPMNENSYSQFKTYMLNFIDENLDNSKTYIVSFYSSYNWILMTEQEIDYNYLFSTEVAGFFNNSENRQWHAFKYTFSNENNDITLEYQGLKGINKTQMLYFNRIFTNSGTDQFLWSNKLIQYNGLIDNSKTYYKHVFTNVPNELNSCGYEDVGTVSIDRPIYSYLGLRFCDIEIKEPAQVTYKIEYYFDDILDSSKTEFKTSTSGTEIKEYTSYATELYKLVEGSYSIILNEDESQNILKIYYRSPLYGTEKSPVETKNSRVWFFFQFSDLKTIFPNTEFGNFTQYQQLVVTILVNIFFCLFLLFIAYITLKASFKCWSWIMGFIT